MHRKIIYIASALLILTGIMLLTQGMNQSPKDRFRSALPAYLPPECLEDTRLRQEVNLEASAVPVAEVLAKLQADTGIALSASREVGHLRTCVHVRQMPLLDLMASLAAVLDLSWRQVGEETKGYELYQTAQQRSRLLQQSQHRTREAVKIIQEAILLAGHQITSGEVIPSAPPQNEVDTVSALAQIFKREPAILGTLSALSPPQLAQLADGEPMLILDEQLPLEVRQMLAGRFSQRSTEDQKPVFIEIVSDPITRSIQFSVRQGAAMWGTGVASPFETDEYRKQFARASDALDEETGKRVVRAQRALTLPEAIAILSRETKLNIIAEYYPLTMQEYLPPTGDAKSLLEQLCTPHLYTAKRLGNTLWLMANFRAEHRRLDIPEPTLKRWFTSTDEFGLTMDIALEIAGLPYSQRRTLALWFSRQQTADNVSPARQQVYSQLQSLVGRSITSVVVRLLTNVPASVKTRVLNGNPLPLRDMAPSTALLEFISYLPPDVQESWFRTNTPYWLQIQRSTTTLWATAAGQIQYTKSKPLQSSQLSETLYQLRAEKVKVYLYAPSGSLLLSEWEWYRYKRTPEAEK